MKIIDPEPVALITTLTPTECAAKLAEIIDAPCFSLFSLSGLGGSKSVIGTASPRSIKLRRRLLFRNDFQSVLAAGLTQREDGTEIIGSVGIDRHVRSFMELWFSMSIWIGGIVFLCTLWQICVRSHSLTPDTWMGLVIPIIFPFAGLVIVWFGRLGTKKEARCLVDFLVINLQAKPISSQS